MNAVYGDTGFWAWLRYWYLDSADFVTLMLMDKGYYDYDYDAQFTMHDARCTMHNKRTHEETQSIFSRMGFGTVKKIGEASPMSAEEMQRIAMEEEAQSNQRNQSN